MRPTRFAGARGRLMPTLHLADLTQMFLWALEREDLEGAFNATSPQPVPNADPRGDWCTGAGGDSGTGED